jgi:branched-chain amino acid transport system permease protein
MIRTVLPLALVVAALAALPLVVTSNVALNFLSTVLVIALAAQGWNILGGYGGQFSFGHAAFFGTGAYAIALLQVRYGINPWLGFLVAIALSAALGWAIGALSFRARLRGSYFALVTLAFAEVLRILVNSSTFTNGAQGVLIRLNVGVGNFQFAERASFYWLALGFVVLALVITVAIERSRFGAYLVAVRENEDAARALGVDTLRVKLRAITLSAGMTGAAGALYAQKFLYIDANIAYGTWISVEALLAPIVGGLGTAFGPIVGAVTLLGLGELTKGIAGNIPGIDLVVFGVLLIVIVAFAPRGVMGILASVVKRLTGGRS